MQNTFELEITSIAHNGLAVGRDDGRAIFVPFGLPGERVLARITQDKGRFAFAEVIEVLRASPDRAAPRCKHFYNGRCGGCHWQHVDYSAQLRYKQSVVIDQLQRIGKFTDVPVHPTIASPDPWAYRTHATFRVTADGRLGFVALDDRTVIPIEECHIVRPPLLDLFGRLSRETWTPGERVRLQIGSDDNEGVWTRIQPTETQPDPSHESETGEPEGERFKEKAHYIIKGRTFEVTAGGFFQVNLPQAETLVNLALERLALTGTERVLDLYSGVGLFTAFIAENAGHVTAIEVFPPAVVDARKNLGGLGNVLLVEGAIEKTLSKIKGTVEIALTDPPRSGMKPAALDALIRKSPRRIVYVSCEPSTLARDARRLADEGYRLLEVQPVDMFPQTYHIESVAVLER